MNEQIKQLWVQAAETTQGDSWEEQTKFIERFAELIVRECVAQCEKNVDHEYLGPGSKLSAFNIKEHFGVEL